MSGKTFYASGENPKMLAAFKQAQNTFKYFWRELSCKYRRIVPALEVACVKVAFMQQRDHSQDPIVEHMWINEVEFNGETVTGVLMNEPNELTNVKNGDFVEILVGQISDSLFATQGKTYGGFTIQAMRSEMSNEDREDHDHAWGFDFGDCNDILLVYEHHENPENLIEHPMSKNMKASLIDFVKQNPEELTAKDDSGNTFLHRETIAGNKTSIEVLKQANVSLNEKNNHGKTALDYAREINWEHIIPVLEN